MHFILGTLIGSFLGVVVLRLRDDKTGIVAGRSQCPQCGKTLSVFELIPILSYVFQRGKCRNCETAIGIFYPMIELVTGLLFYFGWAHSSTLPGNIYLDLIFALLVLISFFDLKYQMIPDVFSYAGIGLVVLGWFLGIGASGAFWGALVFFIFFGLQIWISHEKWLGMGDLILGIFLGLLVGYPLVWLNLFLGYVLGAVIGVSLIAGGFLKRDSQIAFAPFLCLGAVITLIFGNVIIGYYWNCLALGMCNYGI